MKEEAKAKKKKEEEEERERDKESGGAKIRPPHLNSAKLLSQLNLTKLTQSTPPKKKSFSWNEKGHIDF